jgi:hypothetical protein
MAAIVLVGAVVTVLVISLRGGSDEVEPVGSASSISMPVSTTEVAATIDVPATTEVPATPDQTPPANGTVAPSTTEADGRTSPLDYYASCEGEDCPTVRYTAAGLPVAFDPHEKSVTVLETRPRTVRLEIPETEGRLLTVGPADVAYLLVESTEELIPGRILAVATGGGEAGQLHEVVGPTDGLGFVFVSPTAEAIEVLDCCGVGVDDGSYPYVDATGAELPGDPSLGVWSWEWPVDGPVVVRNAQTGETIDVPQQQAEREGPRSGDLRPLLDGRVVMLVDDGIGAMTAWVLEADDGTWTSTQLGDVLVEAIDPLGAVLTKNRSTLSFDLVPLD